MNTERIEELRELITGEGEEGQCAEYQRELDALTRTVGQDVAKVCKHCGSDEVGKEATVAWHLIRQEWVIGTIYDTGFCAACDRDGDDLVIDRETTP